MGVVQVRPCPVCEHTSHTAEPLRHRTPIEVAGVSADLGSSDYSFIRCHDCSLAYKSPVPPSDEIERCYHVADSDHWSPPSPEARRFDELRASILRHRSSGRVLDIGCSAGDFLAYLPGDFETFGIEPGEKAARTAQSRGITILGPDVTSLENDTNQRFDVVVAFDVLEHIAEPVAFLRSIRRVLDPDGVVCILTGNTDCLGWRLEGGDYWYGALPEHLVFFNKSSLERAASRSGLEVVEFRTTAHGRSGPRKILSEAVRNVAYIALRSSGLSDRMGKALNRSAPVWYSGRNHFVAILRAESIPES